MTREEEEQAPQQAPLSSNRDVEMADDTKQYASSTKEVLISKFVISQLIFNVLASFLGPLGTFFLLFGYLSEGPYDWSSGPLVGVVVGSLAGSPLLIFALMPVGLPEAVENGWFPRLSAKTLEDWWMLNILKWRWSTSRNLAIGLLVGIVYVPVALLIARFGLGPSLGTWELIWFNVVYEVLLAIPVLLLGLLGYALEPNLDVTIEYMSNHPNCSKRLLFRVLTSLRMTFCPY